jgi:very-short-patch-repair endonuclease
MVQEHRYYRFRFDFAWPNEKLFVELQSWKWHKTRLQLERDRWKSNIAQSHGWTVFQFSSSLLRKNPQVISGLIRKILNERRTDT